MLTIAISIASGMDAVFSLLPVSGQAFKLATQIGLVVLLLVLNLRGMQESIKVLLPIFLGFFISHAALIVYGILFHADALPELLPKKLSETDELSQVFGGVFVASLLLRSLSLGGALSIGIDAFLTNIPSLTCS